MKAVNLIPADARRRGSSLATGIPFLALIGGLVLALVATLLFVTTHDRVDSRRSQLAAVQTSVNRWTAAAGTYGRDVSLNTSRQGVITKVEGLAADRYDWSVLLGRLGDAMPRRSALSSLTLTQSSSTAVAATSTTSTTGSASTPASSAAGGATNIVLAACAVSQPVVAQTMVNLRRITGVTQVILSSSGRGASAGPAAANPGGCPYAVSFGLTLTFALPETAPGSVATASAAGDPSPISSSTGGSQ